MSGRGGQLRVQFAQLPGGVFWLLPRYFPTCSMPFSGRPVLSCPLFWFTDVRTFSSDFNGLTVNFWDGLNWHFVRRVSSLEPYLAF
jgi:hypothetical protein